MVLVLAAGASTGLGLATAAELVDDGMTSSCAPAPSRPLTGQDLADRALGEPSLWNWWWGAQPVAQYH